ncbi:MAG TPA: hypothetical protein VMS93_13140 [Candidatus Saccharimonadales bacterium]|nr:hypothetical protein [Candidatus Saccharimonadales bacterium]
MRRGELGARASARGVPRFLRRGAIAGLTLAASLLFAAGCAYRGPQAPHVSLGPDLGALRSAFNAGAGSVRVVLLLSPT